MTIEQFKTTRFTGGMKVKYRDDKIYDLASVDFQEYLIGITGYTSGGYEGDVQWVRCENVEIAV